jgi:hypothetical protein
MLTQTRRRALGLLLGTFAGSRLISLPLPARAQDDVPQDDTPDDEATSEPDCFDTKTFGGWTAQASDISAGAIRNEIPAVNAKSCDVLTSVEVNAEFVARIFLEGSAKGTALPENLLLDPDSRFKATAPGSDVVVETPLCGNCTDIYDNTVGIVLPLATTPLLRDADQMDIVLQLARQESDCRFTIDCEVMREALAWAAARRDALAIERDNKQCISAEDCFVTTACCTVLSLGDDCFELRTLRRYRDYVLAKRTGGLGEIARYYDLAPRLLARLRANAPNPDLVLLGVYARYILPAALAAWLGLDRLAYRLYRRMLAALSNTYRGLAKRP